MGRVLSICTGMGLLDRAFMDCGFDLVAGCEIDKDMRKLHGQLCGGEYLTYDIEDLLDYLWFSDDEFDGIIGGPPCQAHTKLKSFRKPKFPDLTMKVNELIKIIRPKWFLFENVVFVKVPKAKYIKLNAMHFAKPHQSRSRCFSYSRNIKSPKPKYKGNSFDLMAYCIVAGKNYDAKRASVLQGYPDAWKLDAQSVIIVKGLANAVHYKLSYRWAKSIKKSLRKKYG